MKMKLEFEGDYYEEMSTFKMLTHCGDLMSCIDEADSVARARLKWGEGVSDEEEKVLEEIRSILNIEHLRE